MSQSYGATERLVAQTETVGAGERVRHFDQLSDDAQSYIVARAAGARNVGPLPDDLSVGDVVVYTTYFRVTAM